MNGLEFRRRTGHERRRPGNPPRPARTCDLPFRSASAAAWHLPLILSGQHAAGDYPNVSAALFVVGVVAAGYLEAYVRLQSGSLWPAVLLHGAWNAIIEGTFDRATVGTPLAVGESGWITMIVSVGVVLFMTRGRWTLQRQPGVPLPRPSMRRRPSRPSDPAPPGL
jgi:hypothetical protein